MCFSSAQIIERGHNVLQNNLGSDTSTIGIEFSSYRKFATRHQVTIIWLNGASLHFGCSPSGVTTENILARESPGLGPPVVGLFAEINGHPKWNQTKIKHENLLQLSVPSALWTDCAEKIREQLRHLWEMSQQIAISFCHICFIKCGNEHSITNICLFINWTCGCWFN